MFISSVSHQRRDNRSTQHSADDKARPALGVLPETSHAQSHDGREDDGLEEQRDIEHAHADVSALRDGRRGEDDAHGHEDAEDDARLDVVHQADAEETADGEGCLGAGEELGTEG